MSGLQFQSFTSADFSTNSTNEQGFAGKIGDKNQLVDDNVSTAGTKRNFFSFGFYQQLFDVDTDQVTKRLLNSVVPTHNNFIADFVQPIPDLYGPFWVSITLVFSIGIFSNIAQYIENEGGSGEYGSDFRMVTGASSLITTYVLLIPFLLYSLIWYRKCEVQYSYFEILCAYGYSLSIFIPVSLLWILDVNWFRWSLIFASVALSGTVLAKAIWPAVKNDGNKLISLGVVFGVVFLHFLLALAFKEYFFDAVHARPLADKPVHEALPTQTPQLPLLANVSVANPPEAAAQVAGVSVGAEKAKGSDEKVKEVEKKEEKKEDVKEGDKQAHVDSNKTVKEQVKNKGETNETSPKNSDPGPKP